MLASSWLLGIALLAERCLAELQSFQPTTNCRTVSAVGQQWYCDGSGIYKPVLAKNTFCQFCADLAETPVCEHDEIIFEDTPTYAQSNDSCVAGRNDPWIACQYTWKCCKCPSATLNNALPPQYCQGATFQYNGCYNCSVSGETLVPNPSSNPVCASQSSSSSSSSTSSTSTSTSASATPTSDCGSTSGAKLRKRADACTACPNLEVFTAPGAVGETAGKGDKRGPSQVVISPDFDAQLRLLVNCALSVGFPGLVITSSSRMNPSEGAYSGTGPSRHQVGMAVDVEIPLANTRKRCTRECMGQAWCANNPHDNLCSRIFTELKDPAWVKRNGLNSAALSTQVYKFMTCAGDAGLRVGATIGVGADKKHGLPAQGDWNHFDAGVSSTDVTARYPEFHKELVSFCAGKCPNAPLVNAMEKLCPH
jgi:hypothetical protein